MIDIQRGIRGLPLTRVQDVLHRAYLANSRMGIAIQGIYRKIFTGYILAAEEDVQNIYENSRMGYTIDIC